MKEQTYTYKEIEKFILEHLYYSMGVNRMVWYDYKTLLIPQLKKQIKNIIKGFEWVGDEGGPVCDFAFKYNQMDIDHILRGIKENHQLFGDYEGYSATVEAINGLGSVIGGK
tara:strand:- start:399 stop:734 length:336 start_codon:yes stop_codon:yes gene_type:complete